MSAMVLIVEDEEELAKLIAQHLEDAGMQTQVHNRCAHAFRFLKRNFANLMLLDLKLQDMDGPALLKLLKHDRRIIRLKITAKGEKNITETTSHLVEKINRVFSKLTREEIHQFISIIEKITQTK